MRKLAIVAVGVLSLATLHEARAADLPMRYAPPPPPPPFFSWTGFYIGANGGGGSSHTDFSLTQVTPFGPTANSGSFDSGGGILGGQIGFNYEFPLAHVVIGIEGDGDWSTINGTNTGCATFTGGFFTGFTSGCATNNVRLDNFETVRGRLGYAFNTNSVPFPSVLLYATGGGAWGNANGNSNATCIAAPGSPCSSGSPLTGGVPFTGGGATFHSTDSGWTAGAGFEWAFFQHWTARIEYLHLQFNNTNTNYTTTVTTAAGTGVATTHISSNTGVDVVRFGVNYLFNWY